MLTGAEEELEAHSCQAQRMCCPASLMSPRHVERQRLTTVGLACVFSCLTLETLIGGVTGTLFAITSASECAEGLAYGISSSWDEASAFFCVNCDTSVHNTWTQASARAPPLRAAPHWARCAG